MRALTENEVSAGSYDISVTRDDLDQGFRGDSNSCPIARAVRRALNVSQRTEICIDESAFVLGCVRGSFKGYDVDAFISDYDNERGVAPFDCVLELDWRDYDND